MTKSQKNLIGVLVSFLIFGIGVFRSDLFKIAGRPSLTVFLSTYGPTWISGISLSLIFFFLYRVFKPKSFLGFGIVVFLELLLIGIYNLGPRIFPDSFKNTRISGFIRGLAMRDRPLIQFNASCACYDSVLFYKLKPGECTFGSKEFNNIYTINKGGFRASEESLIEPQLLFLGDSFTMGWAVGQEDTFAAHVAKLTNLKSLNTGVSSYGTARELYNLKAVDRSKLKAVIIQFHETDFEENAFYIKNKRLGNRTLDEFYEQVKGNALLESYFPFKNLKSAIMQFLVPQITPKVSQVKINTSDFFKIIKEMRNIYSGPIVMTYIGSYYTDNAVIEAFKNDNVDANMHFVNMGNKLNESHYYYFDDHLNAKGHAIVGAELSAKIIELGIK